MNTVKFNVGGKLFMTNANTLKVLPDTKLARLSKECSPEFDKDHGWYFFDRNSTLFEYVLDLYRCDRLHVPNGVCGGKVIEELEFWEIPLERLDDCCYDVVRKYHENTDRMKILKDKLRESVVHFPPDEVKRCGITNFREQVWSFMEYPESSRSAVVYAIVYYTLVLLTCITFVINTHPAFRDDRRFDPATFTYVDDSNVTFVVNVADYLKTTIDNPKELMYMLTVVKPTVYVLDVACYFIFTVDLIIRFLVTPSKKKLLKTVMIYFDIILVITNTIAFSLEIEEDALHENEPLVHLYIACKSFVILRLCRLLNLARHLNGLKVLVLSFKSSFKDLCQLALPLMITILLVSGIMYYAEFGDHEAFPNIPITIWWCVVTMTTVGYGDVTPTTYVGYSIASLCAVLGLILIAMPVAIIASNFDGLRNIYTIRAEKDALKSGRDAVTIGVRKRKNSNKVWCTDEDVHRTDKPDKQLEITDMDTKQQNTDYCRVTH